MINTDKKAFADAFSLTCLAYEKTFNPELASLYFAELSEYSAGDVCHAMTCHRRDADRGRFFPSIADIVYQINKYNKSESDHHAVDLEWSKVLRASAKGIKPTECNQYALAALQMVGGVKVVGYAEVADLARLKKTFIDSYKSLVGCSSAQVPGHLSNAIELKQLKQRVVKRD